MIQSSCIVTTRPFTGTTLYHGGIIEAVQTSPMQSRESSRAQGSTADMSTQGSGFSFQKRA